MRTQAADAREGTELSESTIRQWQTDVGAI